MIQGIQQAGQQEIQRILQPVAYSEAYVNEQIEAKLDDAIKAAMTKQRISLLLNPQAVIAANNSGYNLNQDILTEVNVLIPSAQLSPPAGWVPREVREQQQQQQQQQGAGAGAGRTSRKAADRGPMSESEAEGTRFRHCRDRARLRHPAHDGGAAASLSDAAGRPGRGDRADERRSARSRR